MIKKLQLYSMPDARKSWWLSQAANSLFYFCRTLLLWMNCSVIDTNIVDQAREVGSRDKSASDKNDQQ